VIIDIRFVEDCRDFGAGLYFDYFVADSVRASTIVAQTAPARAACFMDLCRR
jgi:hypothetical protein